MTLILKGVRFNNMMNTLKNNLNTLNETKKIMNKYDIRANKRFGQNFLINDNILQNIIDISNISENDLVIEIGPGLGNLSMYLLNNSKFCVFIEIDKKMIELLNDRFSEYTNYLLLNEDVLKINIDELIDEVEKKNNVKYDKVKVVANLPYYITSPIIFKLFQDSKKIDEIIVMVQKEVADRIVALPKTKSYGVLSVMTKYYADAKIEIIVPSSSFIPPPNVTSAVIKLVKRKKYDVSDEELFFKLIKCGFSERRKKVINSLLSNNFLEMDKQDLEKLFTACDVELNARAEELDILDYIKLANYVIEK